MPNETHGSTECYYCRSLGNKDLMEGVMWLHHDEVPLLDLEVVILDLEGKLEHYEDQYAREMWEERGRWVG